jgi:hypothetical protein
MDAVARVQAIEPGAPLLVAPSRWRLRWLVRILACIAAAGVLFGLVRVHTFAVSREAPAPVRPPTPLRALSDLRPVDITLTTPAWTKVREMVTVDRLRSDRTLWRQMHFGDWDRVPAPIREPALRAMIRAYAPVFSRPRAWRLMGAADWDAVPQPVRAMAYLRMIWYWAIAEDVGAEFGLDPEQLAQTIGAIVMAESWFEHRAGNENEWGNRDVGLAQCSDHCRATLADMSAAGEILFEPTEEDYFNPWVATRIATVWFERELRRSEGDVALAIRAYHRGIDQALDPKGDSYLASVMRLRERYIRTRGSSASWRFLAKEIASL